MDDLAEIISNSDSEDMEDLLDLRKAKEAEKDLPSISLTEAKEVLKLS